MHELGPLEDKGFRARTPERRSQSQGPGPGSRTGWYIRVDAGVNGQTISVVETWVRRMPDTLHPTDGGLYRSVSGPVERREVPLPAIVIPRPGCDHPECALLSSLVVTAAAIHRGMDEGGHVLFDLVELEEMGGGLVQDQMDPLF